MFRKQKVACRVHTEEAQHNIKGNVVIPNKKPWSVFSHPSLNCQSIDAF